MKLQHKTVHFGLAPGAFAFIGASLLFCSSVKSQTADDIIFTPEKIKTIPGHGMSKGEYPFDEIGYYRTEWVDLSHKSPTNYSVTTRDPISPESKEHSNYMAKARLQKQEDLKKQLEKERQLAEQRRGKPTAIVSVPRARVISDTEAKRNGFIGPYAKMQEPLIRFPTIPSFTKSSFPKKPNVAVTTRPSPPQPLIKSRNTPVKKSSPIYHRVDVGDTLFNISKRYGMSVDSLKKVNGLTSDLIKVGQSLRLALAQHALGLPKG